MFVSTKTNVTITNVHAKLYMSNDASLFKSKISLYLYGLTYHFNFF